MCPVVPVTSASQYVPMVLPLGRSNSTRQLVMLLDVPLVIVYFASMPVSQLDVRANVAVAEAAKAGAAISAAAPAVTTVATRMIAVRSLIVRTCLVGVGRWAPEPTVQ